MKVMVTKKPLSIKEYLDEIKPYLKQIIFKNLIHGVDWGPKWGRLVRGTIWAKWPKTS